MMKTEELTSQISISKCWDICLQYEYDKDALLLGMDAFLQRFKGRKILDCSCGTGFLTLDLIKKGYDITCSDGSREMLRKFRENVGNNGLKATPHLCLWSDLGKKFPQRFDLVICRGNSLIYAGSWDSLSCNNMGAITEAITGFHGALKPGGTLYVDTTSHENLIRDGPEFKEYKEKVIDGRLVKLVDRVATDRVKGIRTWTPTIYIEGVEHRLKRHSTYMPHSKLMEILTQKGFEDIKKVKIKGEHYDVFTAKRA